MRTIEEIKADMEIAIEKCDAGKVNELLKEKSLYYIRDIPVHRIKQICNAEKEGRLVVLPVNVGDVVYVNFGISGDYLRKNEKPYACKVVYVGLNGENGHFNIQYGNDRMWTFNFNEIGKTVFLTKEQALKALGGVE